MKKILYILNKHRLIISIVGIIIVCSVAIAIGIYAQITGEKLIKSSEERSKERIQELQNQFDIIFNNRLISDEVCLAYDVQTESTGKYNIDIKMPMFNIKNSVCEKINSEIEETFITKAREIIEESTTNTICSTDFATYKNGDIISMIIRFKLKDSGSKPQRIIIKTYNYDVKKKKILSVSEVISRTGLEEKFIQKGIKSKIKSIAKSKEELSKALGAQGDTIFKRNIDDEMYEIENTSNFFLGQEGYLYIVYAYGNNNYTGDIDVIVF